MAPNDVNSQGNLSDRQLLALPHLISSKSVSEAAKLAGVDRKTIHRWLTDDQFSTAYEEQRDAVAFYARSGMRTLMLKALSVQAERLDSDDPKERARAAKEIMDYDKKTGTNHENQKLAYRLHNLIYNSENRMLKEQVIHAEVDQYLRSQERHRPGRPPSTGRK